MENDKSNLNTKEAAIYLNIGLTRLREHIADGTIPHFHEGRKILIRRIRLDEWSEQQEGGHYHE